MFFLAKDEVTDYEPTPGSDCICLVCSLRSRPALHPCEAEGRLQILYRHTVSAWAVARRRYERLARIRMLQPQSLAAQMTIHWNREDQDVTSEQLLCDPYLTHAFSGRIRVMFDGFVRRTHFDGRFSE